MKHLIPTDDPDFVMPERYSGAAKEPKAKRVFHAKPRVAQPPKFKQGELVLFNHGIYIVKGVKSRFVKHKKSLGDYNYEIGISNAVTENRLRPCPPSLLGQFGLKLKEQCEDEK